jgi:TPR repeat protein
MSGLVRRGRAIIALCSVLTGLGHAQDASVSSRGDSALGRGEYIEAVKWYSLAADQGDDRAQLMLGFIYANGWGIPENDAEAVRWFRLAGEQGDVEAQYQLGVCYASGIGVPKDETEARKWYSLAAWQGDRQAQLDLAVMFDSGRGGAENDIEAFKWFSIAASRGEKYASQNMKLLKKTMTTAQISEAQRLAAEWKRKQ